MAEAFLMGQSGEGLKINDSSEITGKPMTPIKAGDLVDVRNGFDFIGTSPVDVNLGGSIAINNLACSDDGRYILKATAGECSLHMINGDAYTSITIPSPPSSFNNTVDFHPENKMFAIGSASSDKIFTYRLNGNVATSITKPSPELGGYPQKVRFSRDGNFLAGGSETNPRFQAYRIVGEQFVSVTIPDPPTTTVYAIDFSPDGKFMAIGYNASPHLSIYKIEWTNPDSPVFTKLSNPTNLPTGRVNDIKFSQDSKKLLVGHVNSPFLTIYSILGNSFSKDANPSILPPSEVKYVDLSPDNSLVLVKDTTANLGAYRIDANNLYQRTSTFDLGTTNNVDIAFNGSGDRFFTGKGSSPYIQAFKGLPQGITINKSAGLARVLERTNVMYMGISKDSGSYGGSNIKVNTLPIK